MRPLASLALIAYIAAMTLPCPNDDIAKRKKRERRVIRRFMRHIVVGYAVGVLLGVLAYGLFLLTRGNLTIDIPIIYAFAILYTAGMGGGFAGSVIFMLKIKDTKEEEDDNDDDDKPGGGTPERVKKPRLTPRPRHIKIGSAVPGLSSSVLWLRGYLILLFSFCVLGTARIVARDIHN